MGIMALSWIFNAGAAPLTTQEQPTAGAAEYIYAANQGAHNVSGYRVNLETGKLTALPGSPYQSGRFPVSIASSHDGRFVYATNQGSGTVSAYKISPENGALEILPGSLTRSASIPTPSPLRRTTAMSMSPAKTPI